MNIEPTVSVVMPVQNAARYVCAAVESVLAQDYPALELIAVDDGSSDGSRAILEAHGDRITLISQSNQGAAAARNRGLAEAGGDYVLFFDADDLLRATHLSALMQVARAGPAGTIAYAPWTRFAHDAAPNNALPTVPDPPTRPACHGADWLVSEWRHAQPMTQPGRFLLPRARLEALGGWDERLTLLDDFEAFARWLARCADLHFAPKAGLYYRTGHANTLSRRTSAEAVASQLQSLEVGSCHLLDVRDDATARRAVANLFQAFIHEHYPRHGVLRARAMAHVTALGGADIGPIGPPNFHRLRRIVGWKAARCVQRMAGR